MFDLLGFRHYWARSRRGYRVVKAAIERGFDVVPVPGASALLAALAGSGLPTDEFRFIGFVLGIQIFQLADHDLDHAVFFVGFQHFLTLVAIFGAFAKLRERP